MHPDPDLADPFLVGQTYRAVADGQAAEHRDVESAKLLTVASSAIHKGLQIVRFAGVEDREQATALRDLVLWRDAAPADLDEDAFWADELLGCPVVDANGLSVGTLTGVRDGPAHDYLVVTDVRGREVLVPSVGDMVEVLPGRVVLNVPPGLLEEDDAPGGGSGAQTGVQREGL